MNERARPQAYTRVKEKLRDALIIVPLFLLIIPTFVYYHLKSFLEEKL
jgi:hypothetical protein